MNEPYNQGDVPVRDAIYALNQALTGLEGLQTSYLELLGKFVSHLDAELRALDAIHKINVDTLQGQKIARLQDINERLYLDLQMTRTELLAEE